MRNVAIAAIMASLMLPSAGAVAQDVSVPSDSKFFVHINIDAFRRTELGGRLFEMARREAMKEVLGRNKHDDEDHEQNYEKMKETLGLDPFTELDAITIVGSDFKKAEKALHVIFKLKQNAGNLEGLVAALPDYSSAEYGQHVVHSAAPDEGEDQRAFGAIHTDGKGVKRIVAAMQLNRVKKLLDMLDGKSSRESKAVRVSKDNSQFVHIELLEIPREEIGKGPQANVAKMLQGVTINVGDDGENLNLSITLKTEEDRQAKQIRQMVQGFTAMIQLAQDASDEADEDMEKFQDILESLEIKRKKNTVQIRLSIPEDELVDLIEDQMELEL
ncbi:MAG: hypothetical protein AB8G99_15625 [Planctomycetaceae bacterium]